MWSHVLLEHFKISTYINSALAKSLLDVWEKHNNESNLMTKVNRRLSYLQPSFWNPFPKDYVTACAKIRRLSHDLSLPHLHFRTFITLFQTETGKPPKRFLTYQLHHTGKNWKLDELYNTLNAGNLNRNSGQGIFSWSCPVYEIKPLKILRK